MTVVVHSCVPVNHPLKPYGNIKPKKREPNQVTIYVKLT